jgi:hypothetical protein
MHTSAYVSIQFEVAGGHIYSSMSYEPAGVNMLLHMCPHTTIYVSSYYCICVLILLYSPTYISMRHVYSRMSTCARRLFIFFFIHAWRCGADAVRAPEVKDAKGGAFVSENVLPEIAQRCHLQRGKVLVYEALSY